MVEILGGVIVERIGGKREKFVDLLKIERN